MSEAGSGMSGDWDDDFKDPSERSSGGGDGGNKVEYMKMSEPGTYKVRLAGPHVKLRKHFKPYNATVLDGSEGKASSPAWQAGFTPSKRFAINVIDKTGVAEGEVGTLKVLEKGPTVFKNFAAWKGVTGVDPAGPEGPDFVITVKIPKKSNGDYDRMQTEYQVVPVEKTPFTDGEKAMIKEQKLYALKNLYKPTPAEKMQELWDALDDDKKVAPPKPWEKDKVAAPASSGATPPESAPVESAPVGDDMFADASAEKSSTEDPSDLF